MDYGGLPSHRAKGPASPATTHTPRSPAVNRSATHVSGTGSSLTLSSGASISYLSSYGCSGACKCMNNLLCTTTSTPSLGWRIIRAPPETGLDAHIHLTVSMLNTYKADLVSFYDSNGGLPVITPWSSSNCCWALSSSLRWTIGGNHKYPGKSNGVQCCNCETYSGTYTLGDMSSLSSSDTWGTSSVCSDNKPGHLLQAGAVALVEHGHVIHIHNVAWAVAVGFRVQTQTT